MWRKWGTAVTAGGVALLLYGLSQLVPLMIPGAFAWHQGLLKAMAAIEISAPSAGWLLFLSMALITLAAVGLVNVIIYAIARISGDGGKTNRTGLLFLVARLLVLYDPRWGLIEHLRDLLRTGVKPDDVKEYIRRIYQAVVEHCGPESKLKVSFYVPLHAGGSSICSILDRQENAAVVKNLGKTRACRLALQEGAARLYLDRQSFRDETSGWILPEAASLVVAPVYVRNQAVALLGAYHSKETFFDETDRKLLQQLALLVGLALEGDGYGKPAKVAGTSGGTPTGRP